MMNQTGKKPQKVHILTTNRLLMLIRMNQCYRTQKNTDAEEKQLFCERLVSIFSTTTGLRYLGT